MCVGLSISRGKHFILYILFYFLCAKEYVQASFTLLCFIHKTQGDIHITYAFPWRILRMELNFIFEKKKNEKENDTVKYRTLNAIESYQEKAS